MTGRLHLVVAISAMVAASGLSGAADGPGPTAAPPKARVAAPPAGPGPNMQMMQEHMKQMQAQLEKIRQTPDPAEKERLMHEHLAAMQDHMKMMQGMIGARPPMGTDGTGMPAHVIDQRFRMLEQRIDALQQMMEQLMETQKNAPPPPKK